MFEQIGALSEPLWGIEARNAAIANSYFTVAVRKAILTSNRKLFMADFFRLTALERKLFQTSFHLAMANQLTKTSDHSMDQLMLQHPMVLEHLDCLEALTAC
jgi:hypothetical protein